MTTVIMNGDATKKMSWYIMGLVKASNYDKFHCNMFTINITRLYAKQEFVALDALKRRTAFDWKLTIRTTMLLFHLQ